MPQSTGKPLVAYLVNKAAAGWVVAYVRGHIIPFLPSFSLNSNPSGIVSLVSMLCFSIFSSSCGFAAMIVGAV